jgi:hypothetical protein
MSLFCLRNRASCTAAVAIAGLLVGVAPAAHAGDFNAILSLNQKEFRALSEDLASAVSHKPMIPSEGLGITGFDFGVSVGATQVAHRDVLRKASSGAAVPKALPLVAVHAVKGLPFDIDVGITGVGVAGTNLQARGGELRWAFMAGSTVVPAVAARVATMASSGVDQLKLRADTVDVSISKGFAFLTPYAGAGYVNVTSSAPGTTLKREKFGLSKAFAGVNIAFTPLALVVEADRTGEATSYGVKLAVRW